MGASASTNQIEGAIREDDRGANRLNAKRFCDLLAIARLQWRSLIVSLR
jgi:hypothetical protein